MAPLDQRGSDIVDAAECWRLLGLAAQTRKVGHLGISREGAPHVIPVNFSVHDQMILVRLGPGFAAYHLDGVPVAFEIDHAEPHSKRGWSVVACGTARTVTYDEVARLGRNLPRPIVLKPGMRVFSIRPDDITGRGIRRGHGAENEPSSS